LDVYTRARAQAARKVHAIDDSSKGVLTVQIYRCVDLPLVGKTCDSYVELKLTDPDNPDSAETRKTPTVFNERSPRYRFNTDFVYVSATSTLMLHVYDHPDKLELGNIVKLGMKSDTVLGKARAYAQVS
jgi:Ca2+-dependent lipid-binding protein